MEPSRISGECNSSESGWTTYLASPVPDDSNYENEDEDLNIVSSHKQANIDENEDKSDDSMASDASSGPSNLEVSYGRNKKSHFFGQNQSKPFPGQKNSKQAEKGRKFGAEKEVTRDNANAPTCYSKTAEKVKKSKKMGKK